MHRVLKVMFAVAAVAALLMPLAARPQAFPSRPVRLIVPNPPGGGLDIMARLIAPKVTEGLGVAVVVENRPGADGVIASELVAHSPPDGYTLIVASASSHTANYYLMKNLPYHPVNDFTPIVGAVESVTCVAVNGALPFKSLKELIDYAKRNPGKLAYGSTGATGAYTISGEVFKAVAGIDILHIPYKGFGPAMTALVSGEVGVTFTSLTTAIPQVNSGKVRVLAIIEGKRYSGMPDVPTVAETVPGFKGVSIWNGFMGPAGMQQPVVARLNAELLKALQAPDTRAKLSATEVIGGTPQEFAAFVKGELDNFGKIVKLLGLKPE
jgi:tripartite-type tricarboxylate transporter receptor subunit TctC